MGSPPSPQRRGKRQERRPTHRYLVSCVVHPCAATARRVPAASSPARLPPGARSRLPDPLHLPPLGTSTHPSVPMTSHTPGSLREKWVGRMCRTTHVL